MSDKKSIQVTYERKVEVRRPTFNLSANIPYLDATKLSKGSHTIELGRFEGYGGCDDGVVSATVSGGKITGIVYPRCEDATPLPAELSKELNAARRKLSASPKWEDIPVDDFISNPTVARIIIDIIEDGEGCVIICVTVNGSETCTMCCEEWGGCIGPSEPTLVQF